LAADPDAAVRAAAVELLAEVGETAIELLLEARLDPDPRVVEAVATGLGEIASPRALPWLVDAARNHEDRLVREACVAALGAIGDPEALPVLLELVENGPPQVRRRAVVALTVFDDPMVEPAIRMAASDRNPMVREVAEMIVGRDIAIRWDPSTSPEAPKG
jgi:HEAT repeat protein